MPCEVVLLRVDFFKMGAGRCHGNGQNAKELKNTKMIITGYSPNRNWWNLIGTSYAKKIRIGWTNFSAVAMETKKGGCKIILDSFHQTSWNLVEISTVVCGSFYGLTKNQIGGRCHGNQGAKNVKFTRRADPFETWPKNRSSLKVVLFVFKILKMATISKWLPI